MNQFLHFMIKRRGWVLAVVLLSGALFFAFRSTEVSPSFLTQRQKLLAVIGQLIEQQHYSPKKVDDAFSREVFKKFLSEMDGDKTLFLQSDIASLKKFETKIDDEIHGAEIKFEPAVSAIYDKRINEAIAIYKEILASPFKFDADESFQQDADKLDYPASAAERKDRWRKKLKYFTLERYADLLDQKEKAKAGDSILLKSDVQLEKEARERVLKIMNKTFDRIKSTYNEEQRFSTYINSITQLIDPHTDYFPPVEKRAFDEQMSGRFFGIGAQLREDDAGVKIASIVPGGPAWKQGDLGVDDLIIKVGQETGEMVDLTGYAVEDAVKLIRGGKGTLVRLTFKKKDGTVKTITIQREEIVQDEAYARSAIVKQDNQKIGYIYLPDFYANFEDANGHRCSEDVAKEVEKLKAEEVDGIVIDLRNNGGGSLYEVVQMVGLFIPQGPVVQVRDKEGKSTVLYDRDPSVLYDGPLAVMVNEFSASASEIFAAAIQDYKRGVVIGSTSTFGKGTVQRNVPVGRPLDFVSGRTDMGALKLTFQKFYRVSGASTQLKGVVPDLVLPDVLENYKLREKDRPNALPWDEIAASQYNAWKGYNNFEPIVSSVKASVDNGSNFSVLKSNLDWLTKYQEAPVPLSLVKYKENQQRIRETVTQNNNLLKLKEEMKVEVCSMDRVKFFSNPDKPKGDRYQAWLRGVKGDMYIDQSTKIVSELAKAHKAVTAAK